MKANLKSSGLLGLLSILLIFACASEDSQTKEPTVYHDYPLSPIELEPERTNIHLSDLFADLVWIDSISSDEELNWSQKKDSTFLTLSVVGAVPRMFAVRLYAKGDFLDLPLIRSSKKQTEIRIPDKEYQTVAIAGDMNAWNALNGGFTLDKDEWVWSSWLRPGSYGYQLELDGQRTLDPTNDLTRPNGIGGTNSLIVVEGPIVDEAPFVNAVPSEDTLWLYTNRVQTDFLAFVNNREITVHSKGDQKFILTSDFLSEVEGGVRIFGFDSEQRSNDIWIPFAEAKITDHPDQIHRMDPRAMRMYFLMVDRFFNGDSLNDRLTVDDAILPIANFFGGDLEGVYQKVQEGYLDSLHLNTLWLSPIPKNPEGAFGLWDKGGVRSKFSSYHGYWPISFTEIDDRFGSREDLKELTNTLHAQKKNILLDFVANHVHENHPVYQAHKEEGWATQLYLEDGSLNTERWDEYRLTTWFDVFLPSLNLERQDITEMLSDSAMYWIEEYGVDGFRHDATKHIPLNFWRTMSQKARAYEKESGRSLYQIGETYGTADLIGSYLAYGMLDAQFDFNIYDAIVQMITDEQSDFQLLQEKLQQSWAYYGYHHTMGNMSGNQDKARIMSLATGEVSNSEDTKLAGWTREIHEQSREGFQKVALVHALNFAIPGIPVVYYGDEIGMPGGNDPDNRRMMRFEDLSDPEMSLREEVAALSAWRAQELSLIYGNSKVLAANQTSFALLRSYGSEAILFAANKSADSTELELSLPFAEANLDRQMHGAEVKLENRTIRMSLPPYSYDFIRLKHVQYD